MPFNIHNSIVNSVIVVFHTNKNRCASGLKSKQDDIHLIWEIDPIENHESSWAQWREKKKHRHRIGAYTRRRRQQRITKINAFFRFVRRLFFCFCFGFFGNLISHCEPTNLNFKFINSGKGNAHNSGYSAGNDNKKRQQTQTANHQLSKLELWSEVRTLAKTKFKHFFFVYLFCAIILRNQKAAKSIHDWCVHIYSRTKETPKK